MRLLPAMIASALAAPALAATEEDVTFFSAGQEVVGTLSLPDGPPAPVVLLLHGFTGSRDELLILSVDEGVFVRTARLLAEAGYASLRIDFRGSGESLKDLTFADTTFEGQIADALAAFDYLTDLDSVQGDDIYLIGWSQGGLVATAAAGRTSLPDATALWAAVADPQITYAGILGEELMEAGYAAAPADPVPTTLPWGLDIELKGAFFDQVATFDPLAEIAAYSGPLFVAQGTLDTTVMPVSAEMLIEAHEGPEELWTAEMDHVFNAFTTAETLDAMAAATVDFFAQHDD
ncbi:alpha/beta hydrolase family protein [Roseisalinus antarcticus]|uniref:Alpha/beta hydrolase family protein n=1 Tax=Roseisalinus antarcticus TaxID=254357 RepID=A0A1Y5RXY6_9RHOB|nr:alpha/beta fold hydrolase [Roseisalinus antarcticus]SLN28116.1 Alpha/beta hydrolase family protein [Roseisalinus antarcticus]